MPVALVTGASKGIGAACATALAAAGFDVAVGYASDAQGAAETAAAVEALGRRASVHAADVADEDQAGAMVAAAEEALGPLDAVVLNAGITRDGLAVRMSADDWTAVIDTNLSGAFYTARPALRGMLRRRSGSIVAVSSVVGITGNAGQVNYAAAKAGMIGMVRALAREAGPRGVRVNAVAPGYITTDMTAGLSDEQRAGLLAQTPLGRLGEPADVAAAVAFLCSSDAAFVTGAVLSVDGGLGDVVSATSTTVERRRVVVTGIGLVTSLGIGREENWAAAIAGRSGASAITSYEPADTATTIACQIRGFDPTEFMERRTARRMDRFAQLGVAAGRMALEDAALEVTDANRSRIGALVGSGIGGLATFVEQTLLIAERGPDRASPLFIPMVIGNMAAAQVSMELGLKGPLSCISTACASGNHALGDATDVIRRGQADVMLAGGTEATITRTGIAAFNAMRALSTRNDDPEGASRPFDAARDGFVMGEAGAILVLESLEHAISRGAEPVCEVLGYGLTGDAHHLTEPDPTGEAPAAAIAMALADAGVAPHEIDYVNAHATSTPVGDKSEIRTLRRALGDEVAARTMVSSTKSMHGHCLGAAGGVEGALTALAIREGVIPPTINLQEVDPECVGVDHVANTARTADVRIAVSTAFGFGGHNAILVLGRSEER